nr:hypothetical protein CRG98_031993 [Ipomoea trifida]
MYHMWHICQPPAHYPSFPRSHNPNPSAYTNSYVFVERGGGEDDLGEAGGDADRTIQRNAFFDVGDSVQRLRPPVVYGNAEAGNGGDGVYKLGDLLIECEARDEISYSKAGGEIRQAEAQGFGLWVEWIAGERKRS